MKTSFSAIFFALAGALSFSSSAMATSKICFGSTKSDDTKGAVIYVEANENTIRLKDASGEGYDGTYPNYGTTVHAHDGKTYIEYKGEKREYREFIMLDQDLLAEGSVGLLQIRSRGASFYNLAYVCRDSTEN